jgi:hypothetical protein
MSSKATKREMSSSKWHQHKAEKGGLISQFQASLEMLKQTIIQCPEALWNPASDKNKFWQVAYHALHFVYEYLAESPETFTPWVKHREVYDFDESQVF